MPLIGALVQVRQSCAARFLFGLQDGHIIQRKTLKAGVLTQFAPCGQAIVGFIRQFLVVFLAFNRGTEKAHLA